MWEFFFPFFSPFSLSLVLKMEIFHNKKWRRWRRKFTGCWWCFILFYFHSLLTPPASLEKKEKFSFNMPPTRRKRWWTELRWLQRFMSDGRNEGKFDVLNPWQSSQWTTRFFLHFLIVSFHFIIFYISLRFQYTFFSSLQSLFLILIFLLGFFFFALEMSEKIEKMRNEIELLKVGLSFKGFLFKLW